MFATLLSYHPFVHLINPPICVEMKNERKNEDKQNREQNRGKEIFSKKSILPN